MKLSLRVLCSVSLTVGLVGVAAAHAETFTFTATGLFFSATGTLTAIPDPSLPNALEVISISGTAGGATITGLCSTTTPSTACATSGLLYDNLLYPDGNFGVPTQRLDFEGIAFTLSSGLAGDLSAYGTHQDVFTYGDQRGASSPIVVGFSITPTPEPTNLLLLGTGLLGIATTLRRRLTS
jgi:hypothetical protein